MNGTACGSMAGIGEFDFEVERERIAGMRTESVEAELLNYRWHANRLRESGGEPAEDFERWMRILGRELLTRYGQQDLFDDGEEY